MGKAKEGRWRDLPMKQQKAFCIAYLLRRVYDGNIADLAFAFGVHPDYIIAMDRIGAAHAEVEIRREDEEREMHHSVADIRALALDKIWNATKSENDALKLTQIFDKLHQFEKEEDKGRKDIAAAVLEGISMVNEAKGKYNDFGEDPMAVEDGADDDMSQREDPVGVTMDKNIADKEDE